MAEDVGPGTQLHRAAQIGLLNYLTETSLDEDYQEASVRRQKSGPQQAGPNAGRLGLVVLAAFGILLATAAVQTARNSGQTASNHAQLVKQVNDRKAALTSERTLVTRLRNDVSTSRATNLATTSQARTVQARFTGLGGLSGDIGVRGPGIKVVVADAPGGGAGQQVLDKDLQALVNGLWQVGAEAISINGQRLTSLTSIRVAGQAITVNYESLEEPYVVSAIGNRSQMPTRFLETAGGQTWLALKSDYGLQFDIKTEDSMTLPAEAPLTLSHARAKGGGTQ
jgi:uncharacterized protein YlxW (UPF0749 family)